MAAGTPRGDLHAAPAAAPVASSPTPTPTPTPAPAPAPEPEPEPEPAPAVVARHRQLAALSLALTVAVCGVVLYGLASVFPYSEVASKSLVAQVREAHSMAIVFLVDMAREGKFAALAVALGLGGLFACTAAVLGTLIMARAPNAPANRQVAGLLLAFAALSAWRYFLMVLPVYKPLREVALTALEWGDAVLLCYLALGLARLLAIFPRAVDTDSVHQAYMRRPVWLRWASRSTSRGSLLRHWHQALVSGRILWLALAGPTVAGAITLGMNGLLPFEKWGGAAVAGLGGLLFMYFVYGLPYAFASLTHIYHFGTLDERRRVAWLRAVLLGLGLLLLVSMVVPFVATFTLNLLVPPSAYMPGKALPLVAVVHFKLLFSILVFWASLPAVAIIAVGVAVLNGGALDPRLAFTRVTVWSLMGLGVTLGFIVIERYAAVELAHWFNLPNDTGTVAAGAIVAGSFVPVRNFATTQVNRLARRWIPLELVADGARVVRSVAITDLSGYTALSSTREADAILQSAALRRQAELLCPQHGGRLVKTLGDAVMMRFDTAPGALRCVQALHGAFAGTVAALGLQPLPLHSAVHHGEIVEAHDGDIFGQTVNVTARLVDAAGPGEVVVSQAVGELVGGEVALRDIGSRKFKNVPQPVHCLVVVDGTHG